MGLDPRTSIWAGYRAEDLEGRLPDEILEQIRGADLVVDGVRIISFEVSDERVGYGIELLHHDWNNDIKELCLSDLVNEAHRAKVQVAKIFKEWGIDDEPSVFLLSDMS